MEIRKFKEKDKASVEEIFSKYWNDPTFLKELSSELNENPSNFYVAEDHSEIVGIVGYKNIPDYLKKFAKTPNPVELYIIASKHIRRGIGKILKSKIVKVAKYKGFSEILLFSPRTHNNSWEFHDTLNFQRLGEVTPPNDEIGYVWSRDL